MSPPHAESTPPTPSDAELCRRIAARRPPAAARAALAELYARHAPALLAFLRRRRADLAEDLLQDTFLILARRAAQFEGASARPWLLAIARSQLLQAARRERTAADHAARRTPPATPAPPSDPDLAAALARLPQDQAELLDLRFVQDLTHAQTAQLLGVSLRTAKARTAAALAALRRQLER